MTTSDPSPKALIRAEISRVVFELAALSSLPATQKVRQWRMQLNAERNRLRRELEAHA